MKADVLYAARSCYFYIIVLLSINYYNISYIALCTRDWDKPTLLTTITLMNLAAHTRFALVSLALTTYANGLTSTTSFLVLWNNHYEVFVLQQCLSHF